MSPGDPPVLYVGGYVHKREVGLSTFDTGYKGYDQLDGAMGA